MFGRRKREEAAAAEAAREADRHALFARLAERPEHICPFLGLAEDRTGYVEGVSDDHRCFAFGEPAPLSAEQQTRVCQERGYGNCPRYLRGVLVIPTEELEALRQRRAPLPEPTPPPPPVARERRRGSPILLLLAALVLLVGGAGAYFLFSGGFGTAVAPSPTPSLSPEVAPSSTSASSLSPEPSPSGTAPQATPTLEPTPDIGDAFAFYEVSVGPARYTLFSLDGGGAVVDATELTFAGYSFARAEPISGADDAVYWVTQDGDLAGLAYRYPDSGEFRIRAVFLNAADERRSTYLEQEELTVLPEATPAP